jgi:hypothetical protein
VGLKESHDNFEDRIDKVQSHIMDQLSRVEGRLMTDLKRQSTEGKPDIESVLSEHSSRIDKVMNDAIEEAASAALNKALKSAASEASSAIRKVVSAGAQKTAEMDDRARSMYNHPTDVSHVSVEDPLDRRPKASRRMLMSSNIGFGTKGFGTNGSPMIAYTAEENRNHSPAVRVSVDTDDSKESSPKSMKSSRSSCSYPRCPEPNQVSTQLPARAGLHQADFSVKAGSTPLPTRAGRHQADVSV